MKKFLATASLIPAIVLGADATQTFILSNPAFANLKVTPPTVILTTTGAEAGEEMEDVVSEETRISLSTNKRNLVMHVAAANLPPDTDLKIEILDDRSRGNNRYDNAGEVTLSSVEQPVLTNIDRARIKEAVVRFKLSTSLDTEAFSRTGVYVVYTITEA
jgi:hypothetical protein